MLRVVRERNMMSKLGWRTYRMINTLHGSGNMKGKKRLSGSKSRKGSPIGEIIPRVHTRESFESHHWTNPKECTCSLMGTFLREQGCPVPRPLSVRHVSRLVFPTTRA